MSDISQQLLSDDGHSNAHCDEEDIFLCADFAADSGGSHYIVRDTVGDQHDDAVSGQTL